MRTLSTTCFAALLSLCSGLSLAVMLGEFTRRPIRVLMRTAAVALIAAVCGLIVMLLPMGRPELIFGILSNPKSPLFWQVTLSLVIILSLGTFLVGHLRLSEESLTRSAALFAGGAALPLMLAIGQTNVMAWRPLWNTELIAIAFVLFTVVIAAGSLRLTHNDQSATVPVCLTAFLLALVLTAYGVFACEADADGMRILTGDLAPLYIGAGLLGVLIPLVLQTVRHRLAPIAAILAAVLGTAAFQSAIASLGLPAWHFF